MALAPNQFETDPMKRLASRLQGIEYRANTALRQMGTSGAPDLSSDTVAEVRGGAGGGTTGGTFHTDAGSFSHGMSAMPDAVVIVASDPVIVMSVEGWGASSVSWGAVAWNGANKGFFFFWIAVVNDAIDVVTP